MMIIENLLNKEDSDYVHHVLMNPKLQWFWKESIVTYSESKINPDEYFGFIHHIYIDDQAISDLYTNLNFIVNVFQKKIKFKLKKLVRIQANLLTRMIITEFEKDSSIHKDSNKNNYISLVYYVNDSDGDTLFFDENKNYVSKCTPNKGSAVWFKSNQWHAATPPKITKRRVVLNFIFELMEDINIEHSVEQNSNE